MTYTINNSRRALNYAPPPVRVKATPPEQKRQASGASDNYSAWLRAHFPRAVSYPFAPRHIEAWAWFAALAEGVKPPALIACWPRGGGKSTTIELGCVYAGMRQARTFVLYVSATQAQADAHVQAIATKLEALGVDRALNKYQQSRGWTQQILRAANGFNVVSLGLDAAARGIKLDDYRPDLIVLDDVDSRHDSAAAVDKKIETLTQSILPSGDAAAAVVFVQNKIHDGSIMAQVLDGRADMLQHRAAPTVERAIDGLQVTRAIQPDGTARYVAEGVPTWPGQDLGTVTAQINEWGLRAFLREAQHETDQEEGGLWQRERDIAPFRVALAPQLVRVVIGVDPPGGATECGIVGAGVDARGHAYVLEDASVQASPEAWGRAVVTLALKLKADCVVVEKNFGGDMAEAVINSAARALGVAVRVKTVTASRGKVVRAEPVQGLAEQGKVHHVGTFVALERELCTYQPGMPSPNRLDAAVWAVTELALSRKASPLPPSRSMETF